MHRGLGFLAAALLLVGCGGEAAEPTAGPKPSEMCPAGQFPILAAYALKDGEFRWVTCDASPDMHVATAASDTDVWIEVPYPREMLRVDAATGRITARGEAANFPGDVPDDADWRRSAPPGTASVQVRGGQDDALVGIDTSTGAAVWRAVGFPPYDDVWAGDDEAVYVRSWDPTGAKPGSSIVAYLIESGEPRWRIDAPPELGEPWHVADGRLFSMWFDLNVIDTRDGSVSWHTSYGQPETGFPRMFGAVTNDDTVFVSFTSTASGGD
jgi:hypothetical protein